MCVFLIIDLKAFCVQLSVLEMGLEVSGWVSLSLHNQLTAWLADF